MKKAFQISFILFILINLWSCANRATLEGGPRDTQPPVLDTLASTPNFQTNFKKQRIELTFNEWLQLKDVATQVIISPPLQHRPDIVLRGKTVRFEFDENEQLRENATYTINFGNAIQDLTEGNAPKDLRFVFSTGDYIDSLEVTGRVTDALTGESVEKVLVMLYDNLADSVVRTERPFYFARTDTAGVFRIQNVRADTFKVFALEDGNVNYLFDAVTERIGFIDSTIVLNDTTQVRLDLQIFAEEEPLRLVASTHTHYGLSKLRFNIPPTDLSFRYEMEKVSEIRFEYEKDTVRVWYELPEQQNWQLYVRKDTLINDTVTVRVPSKTNFLQTAKLQLDSRQPSGTRPLHPSQNWSLLFNRPLEGFDTSLIRLYEDTLRTLVQPVVQLDTVNAGRQLSLRYNWKEGLPYELQLLPGAVTDMFGISTADSINQSKKVAFRKDFGSISLIIDSLNSENQYIIQLFVGESDIINTFIVTERTSWQQQFTGLAPGNYTVKITLDRNKNGRWDTGNYDLRTYPEPILTRPLEALRANWEVEAQVALPSGFE